jgi:hypothetical protein
MGAFNSGKSKSGKSLKEQQIGFRYKNQVATGKGT